jgi:RimJ/RimL family protein N-acetyltransferase
MRPNAEQARIVASLKSGSLPDMSIPIASAEGAAAGFLTPITYRLAEDAAIIDALFRWRRSHMKSFLTVFNPTLEKTRNYLTAFSLPDAARILFLVVNRESRFVGHIGLCNIAPDGGEIDNVIRGEPVDMPGFMVCAHTALLGWAFPSLDLPLAYLNVLADNTRAIQTYEKIGFRAIGRTPLLREEHEGGYRLRPMSASCGNGTGPMLIRMEILRDSFYRKRSR